MYSGSSTALQASTGLWIRNVPGEEIFDHLCRFLHCYKEEPLLHELWSIHVVDPPEYFTGGQIEERREHDLMQGSRILMAKLYSRGQMLEMIWLITPANYHARQVNRLYENILLLNRTIF